MVCAAQGRGVAIAFEKATARHGRDGPVDVEAGGEFGIAQLQRRMHEFAGHHGVLAFAPETNRDVVRRVAGVGNRRTWSSSA